MRGWMVLGMVGLLACDVGVEPEADAGGSTGVVIRAAEGGEVTSSDGIFTLIVPPGALAEDTTISITALPRDRWPAEVLASAPDSSVYDVGPDGLEFVTPAFARFALPAAPEGLREGSAYASLIVRSHSAEGDATASSLTVWGDAGDVTVAAAVEHLSLYWMTRDGPTRLRVEGEAGSHPVGATWSDVTLEVLHAPPAERVLSAASTSNHLVVPRPDEWEPIPVGVLDVFAAAIGDTQQLAYDDFGGVSVTGDVTTLEPPLFVCASVGTARLAVGAAYSGHTVLVPIGEAECTAAVPSGEGVVGTVQQGTASPDGTIHASSPESIVLNLVAYDDSVLSQITAFDDQTSFWEGVGELTTRPDSPAEVVIVTSNQEITATGRLGVYEYAGFDPSEPIYCLSEEATFASDTSTVRIPASAHPSAACGGAVSDQVEVNIAPEGGTLADVRVRMPDGLAAAILLVGTLSGSSTAGEAGFRILVGTDTLPLAGGWRELQPFAPAFLAELALRGLTLAGSVLIGVANRTDDTTFWPAIGPIPFLAGRFLRVPIADLVTLPAGSALVRDCSALPATFPPLDPESTDPRIAIVCVDDADAYCRASNDLYEDDPLLPTQCAGTERAVHLNPDRTTGAPMACPGSGGGWMPVWSSRGIYGASHCMYAGGAVGEAQFFEVQRVSDGARRRVAFRASGPGTVEVTAVESDPTGPYPAYGAQHSCREPSITFPAPADPTLPHATLQLNNVPGSCVPCLVNGDTSVTPEVETGCGNVASFQLLYTESGVRSAGFSTAGGSSGWSVESASSGTIVAPRRVLDFPVDTDVTVVVTNGTQRWQIVFRHTSANEYVVSAITRL